jgi:hypothetical protein
VSAAAIAASGGSGFDWRASAASVPHLKAQHRPMSCPAARFLETLRTHQAVPPSNGYMLLSSQRYFSPKETNLLMIT